MSLKTLRSHCFLAAGLFLPIVVFYAAHASHTIDARRPTGFVQYDVPYYMANARQYFDGQSEGIYYSNPYDFRTDAPKIYFQPQIALVSIPFRAMQGSPALLFLIQGAITSFVAIVLISILVDRICPGLDRNEHALLTLLTCWGGGMLALMGLGFEITKGTFEDVLRFDPKLGWWFLNFGRNLLIPSESLYHMLAAAIWLAVAFGRIRTAIAATLVLAMAHPFTGVQYSLILLSWLVLERLILRSGIVRTGHVLCGMVPIAYSLGYYLFYLSRFPSHRELVEQWTVFEWFLAPISMVGALTPCAALALLRCRSLDRLRACFADPLNRLLGLSFLVSLTLSKHELLIKPHQPIHFARGHICTPLFLLALPLLAGMIMWLRQRGAAGIFAIAAGCLILLSDNATFIVKYSLRPTGIYMADTVRETFAFLRRTGGSPILVTDEYDAIGYLSAVYSGARPYIGHYANTRQPEAKKAAIERFFTDGTIPADLAGGPFLVITSRYKQRMSDDLRFEPIFGTGDYMTFRLREAESGTGAESPKPLMKSNAGPHKTLDEARPRARFAMSPPGAGGSGRFDMPDTIAERIDR